MKSVEIIEQTVKGKKILKAKRLITTWLRNHGAPADIFLASQWYRRLSLYKEGLRLVMSQNPFDVGSNKQTKLLVAELFSHIGASSFALQTIENLEPKTSDEFEIIAGIYFANNRYKEALNYFEKRINRSSNIHEYNVRLSRLSCADCLARLGRIGEAIQLCKDLLETSQEPLFVAMCQQAMGEYFARQGKIKSAIKWLQAAEASFPKGTVTYDHALLFRWLGFTNYRLGNKSLGTRYLKRSTKIIRDIGLGEETWLVNMGMERDLNILSRQDLCRLEFFPGLPKNFFKKIYFPKIQLGPPNAPLAILLNSDEFTLEGKSYLGIPMELRLIGCLKIAGKWGLSFEYIKNILWKSEAKSYLQLEARLRQMLKRIVRRYKIKCYVKNKHIYLHKTSDRQVSVLASREEKLPIEIRFKDVFTSKEFQKMYNLSVTQAAKWLGKFCKRGGLHTIGSKKFTKYRVGHENPNNLV